MSLKMSKLAQKISSSTQKFGQRGKQPLVEGTKLRLEDLSVEILLHIFSFLSAGPALCLALSSPHMYQIYKRDHPTSPSLWSIAEFASGPRGWPGYPYDGIPIGAFLQDWMGPAYRPLCLDNYYICPSSSGLQPSPAFFLKRSVYGWHGSPKEDEKVLKRYTDYERLRMSAAIFLPGLVLPNPKISGRRWGEEISAIILQDASRFARYEHWAAFWLQIVPLTYICGLSLMQKLEALEGFEETSRDPGLPVRKEWEKALVRYTRFLGITSIPLQRFYLKTSMTGV